MKIFIIGSPGSGKTYLANKLSKELEIPYYELDKLQWDHGAGGYGQKRNRQERDELLNGILDHEDWIIEGVYIAWCGRCFEEAEKIYFMNVSRYKCCYRIVRRFIRRKLGIERGNYKETWEKARNLMKRAYNYPYTYLGLVKTILDKYSDKVTEIE